MSTPARRALLGVSGSIAAYRAADLCSQLVKAGFDVHVILTRAAAEFVGGATFRGLTANEVITGLFDEPIPGRIAHIEVAQKADVAIVAPATANTIARLALGLADDFLSSALLALPPSTPLILAPAMNRVMWEAAATQHNIDVLRKRGATIVPPATGLLACGDYGEGKLADVDTILRAVADAAERPQDLAGRQFLVTAGATREFLDPVRFISNRSSGKMGFAIAHAARARGAGVTLVAAHTSAPPPAGIDLVRVESADEMLRACLKAFPRCDAAIGAAAVADFASAAPSASKIKKTSSQAGLTLRLAPTTDIVAALAARREDWQRVIGFAAESENVRDYARGKLASKRLDLIAANDISRADAGFDADTNEILLVWPDGREQALPLQSKRDAADRLLDAVAEMLPAQPTA